MCGYYVCATSVPTKYLANTDVATLREFKTHRHKISKYNLYASFHCLILRLCKLRVNFMYLRILCIMWLEFVVMLSY